MNPGRGREARQTAGASRESRGAVASAHDPSYLEAVATVTHELKSPLSTIRGYARMLRDDDLDAAEIRDFAGEIHDSAVRLARYVDSILEEAAGHADRASLHVCDVRLAPVVGRVLRELEARSRGSHRLVNDVGDGLAVRADVERLVQVIRNLADNAVKYSPQGGAVRIAAIAGVAEVELLIEDEGIGITPGERSRVFERFYRVPSAVITGIEGTGLGLSIVGDLVALQRGRIWITEGPGGRGSTFHVSLPRAAVQARLRLLRNRQADDLPLVAVRGRIGNSSTAHLETRVSKPHTGASVTAAAI